jgi:hypothetical protein|uniref:JmjC domain-containing protein n=1 Tax=Eutreptiella gymnastica TaxID=73025 RepID=A0A7S4FVL6_9EUGL|eukprot:CAMPEP_0174293662 /NCGR_PEP_ID=MMETSP0809-20121228/39323_1 /TAXON_ID=73025 ORGANISM="Eutreptiella gymnastica-like, Strain CCMP1594" /NCGR_SAMPLE_ID=MMETSP0809 /ASSEMBLY_ACC=CAM_ASM_000658 /LENGTH=312 /DNA_ID=CAMNT_0015394615 /DNA_START=27 /DNA_END=965 /DNA_ORIENTATION=+
MDLLRRVPQQQEVFNLGGRTLTPDLVQELLRDSTVQRQGFALVQNDASWWHSFWRDTPPERILTSPEVNAEGLQVLRDTQKAVPKEAIREQVRQVLASRVPPDPAQLDWNGDYYVVSNTGGVGLYSHDMETLFSTRIKGVTRPWLYIHGPGTSARSADHTEDLHLPSIHSGIAGTGFKIWGVASPSGCESVVSAIRKEYGVSLDPDESMFRKQYYVTPEMIYKHSLPYNFMKLSSNMTVIVAPKARHHVYTAGSYLSCSMNLVTPDWVNWHNACIPQRLQRTCGIETSGVTKAFWTTPLGQQQQQRRPIVLR